MTCRICGTPLTRDGCPYRLHHAVAVRESGFTPEQRGAPSKPGPPEHGQSYTLGILRGPQAREFGMAINAAIKAADKPGKVSYLIEVLTRATENFGA